MDHERVVAKTEFGGEPIQALVLNPGGWFGKTWLVEIGGSYSPIWLVVEAASASDAIDEIAESDRFSHHIVVPESDLADYDEESCHYGPQGQVLDLDHLMIHGNESPGRSAAPWPCVYHGDHLPAEGIDPPIYDAFLEWVADDPRKQPV